ncbi:hypothetical protein TNCV_1738191 [Trichonephila clavipes]|nr:hypothetical protein TNCV_1738191 [Trichonephila clavipes]
MSQLKHLLSPYVHMERTKEALPRFQSSRNWQLWWRRFNDLGRHCWMAEHLSMSLKETGVRYRDEVLEPYVHRFMGERVHFDG